MATDEEIRKRAAKEAGLKDMGLVVLLERAGGWLSFTEAEYQAVLERNGGRTQMAVHIEVTRPTGGGEPSVELTLVRKPPSVSGLVS